MLKTWIWRIFLSLLLIGIVAGVAVAYPISPDALEEEEPNTLTVVFGDPEEFTQGRSGAQPPAGPDSQKPVPAATAGAGGTTPENSLAVPEPGTALLLGIGLAGFFWLRRRRQ